MIGSVDDPSALAAWLKAQYLDQLDWPALDAVAARTIGGGPAHPRITIVYIADSEFCGSGGCTLFVLVPDDDGLIELSHSTITHAPIRVLPSRTNGMPDLSVRVCGGGILECYSARLAFDGRRYPLNPTVPPAERLDGTVRGETIISEEDADRAFRWGSPKLPA